MADDDLKATTPQTKSSRNIVLVKIGGSSITHKAEYESLNRDSLDWFSRSVAAALSNIFRAPLAEQDLIDHQNDDGSVDGCPKPTSSDNDSGLAFVLIHGAGSFGHFSAKAYGLKGQSFEPPSNETLTADSIRYKKQGLATTRLSVQRLNHIVVESLVRYGVNAVGISPCFGVPGMEAHSGIYNRECDDPMSSPVATLRSTVLRTIQAGLIPVLHGDACLYGDQDAGILSGDTLMEVIGKCEWITDAVFITDVDGVFNKDPRQNSDARLLRRIFVDPKNGEVATELRAGGSSHEHDVTGGLKTKLKSASAIAATGKNVSIVKHSTHSAENALRQLEFETGSIISPLA